MTVRIRFRRDGTTTFLYEEVADALGEERMRSLMHKLGVPTIQRASFVEPTPDGLWTADMAPSRGPILGPFNLRKDARRAEVEWLEAHRI